MAGRMENKNPHARGECLLWTQREKRRRRRRRRRSISNPLDLALGTGTLKLVDCLRQNSHELHRHNGEREREGERKREREREKERMRERERERALVEGKVRRWGDECGRWYLIEDDLETRIALSIVSCQYHATKKREH
jgi:hypothetical protein